MKKVYMGAVLLLFMMLCCDSVKAKETSGKSLGIRITDAVTGECVPGVSAVLKNAGKETIENWISTEETYVAEGLSNGRYTVQIIEVPEGYVPKGDSDIFFGEGYELDHQSIMEVELYTSSLQVAVRSADDFSYAGGVELAVLDNMGNEIGRYVSESDGYIRIAKLASGTYRIKQISVPTGYEMTEDVPFTVLEGAAIAPIEIYLNRQIEVSTPSTPVDKNGEEEKKESVQDKEQENTETNQLVEDVNEGKIRKKVETGDKAFVYAVAAVSGILASGIILVYVWRRNMHKRERK